MKKALLWIIIAPLALVVVVVAGALLFFPEEKARAFAEEWTRDSLGSPVKIGSLKPSFWSGFGVEVKGIVLGGTDVSEIGAKPLAQIKSVDVKLQFWPLLMGEYRVDRLIIDQPIVRLRRYSESESNFHFPLFDEETDDSKKQVAPSDEASALAGGFSFEDVQVNDASVYYENRKEDMKISVWGLSYQARLSQAGQTTFESVGEVSLDSAVYLSGEATTSVPQLAMAYDFGIDIESMNISAREVALSVFGAEIELAGTINDLSDAPSVDLSYSVSELNLKTFTENLQSALPELWNSLSPGEGAVIDGKVEAKGVFKLSAREKKSLSANGSAREFSLALPDWPAPVTSAKITFEARTNSFALDIPSARCAGSEFSARMSLSDFDNPVVDLTIKGAVPLAALNYMLPETGNPELGGNLTIDLGVSGAIDKPEQMKISGSARVRNGSYRAATLPENVESFDMDVKIDTKVIDLNSFNVAFTSSDFNLRGSLKNPFPYFLPVSDSVKASSPAPHLEFVLESKRFNVDRLFPEAAPGSGVNRASMPADSAPPLFLPDMNGSGVVRFDTVIYADVEFRDLSADVRINRRLIHIENIRGLAMDGSISGKALVDLSDFEKPKYSGDFKGEKIEVEAFVKRFSSSDGKGLLSGKVDLKGSYECEGWEAEDFINSLTMDINAIGDTVRVTESPLISAFSNTLASLTKDDSYRNKFKSLTFSGFKSELKFVSGRLQIPGMSGNSAKIGPWSLLGSIGVDGSLDLKGTVFPPHELVMSFVESNSLTKGFSEYLRDDTLSKFEIPLTITGKLEKPIVSLDMKIVDDIAKRMIKNKLQKDGAGFLKDLFGGDKK